MIKLKKISFVLLFSIGLSAITLAASNIFEVVKDSGTEIVVFPNPVLGNEFNIKANQDIVEVVVVNVLGQKIFTQDYINQKRVNIELIARERGLFLVQIKIADDNVVTKRILFK
jgi:hypothetical protein